MSLDDPILFDGMTAFSGFESAAAPSRLEADTAALMQNIDRTRRGTPRTRAGVRAVGELPGGAAPVRGLAEIVRGGAALLHAAKAGKLHQTGSLAADAVWTEVFDGLDAAGEVEMAPLIDRLYFTDGAKLRWHDGTASGEVPTSVLPPVSLLLSHTYRLFAAGDPDAPDMLYVSALLDGETWPAADHRIRVGEGGLDPITALVPWQGNLLVVVKRRSTWVVNADPQAADPGAWQIFRVGRRGGRGARSAAEAGEDPVILADDGLFGLRQLEGEKRMEFSSPLSAPVEDILRRVTAGAGEAAAAIAYDGKVLLSLALDGAAAPGHVLVYSLAAARWLSLWTGLSPRVWSHSHIGGVRRLVFGEPGGRVVLYGDREGLETDHGETPVPVRLRTRALSFESVANKAPLNLEIEWRNSRAAVDVMLLTDGGEALAVASGVDTGPGGPRLPLTLPFDLESARSRRRAWSIQHARPGREFQVELVTESLEPMALRHIRMSAFPDDYEIEI